VACKFILRLGENEHKSRESAHSSTRSVHELSQYVSHTAR
jgi:hypothetical protein